MQAGYAGRVPTASPTSAVEWVPPQGGIPTRYLDPTLLRPDEKVLLEQKPAFLAFLGLGGLIWEGLGVVCIALIVFVSILGFFTGWMLLYLLLFGIPLLIAYFMWRVTWYALTDSRIMVKKGTFYFSTTLRDWTFRRSFGMTDVQTIRVLGVGVEQGLLGGRFGYATVTFRTSGGMGGGISWVGVRNPWGVRQYVEDSINRLQTQEHVGMAMEQAVVDAAAKVYAQQYAAAGIQLVNQARPPTQIMGTQPMAVPSGAAPPSAFSSSQDSTGVPLAAPLPPAQPALAGGTPPPPCPTCSRATTYIPQYERYYCLACNQYV